MSGALEIGAAASGERLITATRAPAVANPSAMPRLIPLVPDHACRFRRSERMMQMGLYRNDAPLEGVMVNLNFLLARAVADHGGRAAVRQDDLVLTYSQLRDAAGRAASLLASAGVGTG